MFSLVTENLREISLNHHYITVDIVQYLIRLNTYISFILSTTV